MHVFGSKTNSLYSGNKTRNVFVPVIEGQKVYINGGDDIN